LIERLADRGPVVMVLEDLHWADSSSRELLEHVLPLANTKSLHFVVLSRSDAEQLAALRQAGSRELPPDKVAEIALKSLSLADSEKLFDAILGGDEQFGRLRRRILNKVDGNPFFLEEVVRELIDVHALVRDEVRGTWSARNIDIAIPQTVEGVLIARIDRLDERLRNLLSIAAVIGRRFLYRLLRAITAADIDGTLAKLSASELIEELRSSAELEYLFRHALTHQAVYDSLLLEKRRELHARVAQILEELYAGRLQEITSLLAFHYARADDPDRSLPYLVDAAQQASRMAADSEALALLEQAVAAHWKEDAVSDGPALELRCRIEWQLGEIHFRRGDHETAERHLLQAIEPYSGKMPNTPVAFYFALMSEGLKHVMNMLRWTVKPRQFITEMAPLDELRILPYETLGWIYFLSDQRRMLLMVLRAGNLAFEVRSVEGISKALAGLGFALTFARWYRLAARYNRTSLALAEEFQANTARVFAMLLRGDFLVVRGRWRDAEKVYEEVRLAADKSGDLRMWSDASAVLCYMWNETGDFDRVFETSATMISRGKEAIFQPAIRWGLASRGAALCRTGRIDEALPILEEAFRTCVADKDIVSAAVAGHDLAMALIFSGRFDQAAAALNELRHWIIDRKFRVFTICGIYVALAELALRRFEAGTATRSGAHRACIELQRVGRVFKMARPKALRLQARLAMLSGRPRRANRLWRRAAVAGEALGARYELALIAQERASRGR
jgi:tetratricopeptide (TPR) repeat protein